MDIIKSLIQNSDGLGFSIAAMTLIYSIYSSRHAKSRQIIKEQHDKLISPIFSLIEPYLFKDIDNSLLENILNIVDENKSLVDGKLLEITYFCKENPSQSNYNALCSYINKTYDKSCRHLGLRLRSIEYRLSRKQYKTKFFLFLYLGIYLLKALLNLSIALFIFLSFIGIGSYFFNKTQAPEKDLVFLLISMFVLLAFFRYLDE